MEIDSSVYQSIMDAVLKSGPSAFLPSVTAMVKNAFLLALPQTVSVMGREDAHLLFTHPILPAKTAVIFPSDDETVQRLRQRVDHRVREAYVDLLAEFLESCVSNPLPFKAVETIVKIGTCPPEEPIHDSHQIRLASSIQNLFVACDHDLAGAVLNHNIFDLYVGVQGWWYIPWLDNAAARERSKPHA